jgi:hypothetical protein
VDDFVKGLERHTGLEQWNGERGPKRRLSLSEIMTLNITRFFIRVNDLKSFHRLLEARYKDCFPGLPNYANFLKATNASAPYVITLLEFLLYINRRMTPEGVFFMDSTSVSVCFNYNIYNHQVARGSRVTGGYAKRGKTTKGWFYGFKLHGACDRYGRLLNIVFTRCNEHDSQLVKEITEDLSGIFVGDAGYIVKREVFEKLYAERRHIMSAPGKNMKKVMASGQWELLRRRGIIETTLGVMKERLELVYHKARSMEGLFRHYFYSISSFLIKSLLGSDLFSRKLTCFPQ